MKEKIIKYLKENISIIAIILFFINFLGYLYMISQLEYFNIDRAFYQSNIFNDFYAFFIIATLIAIPIAIAIIPTAIISMLSKKNINIKEINNKQLLKGVFYILLVFVIISISIQQLYKLFSLEFKPFIGIIILSIIIAVCYKVFIWIIPKGKVDIIDKIFTVITLLALIAIFIYGSISLGTKVAENKKDFMLIDNQYVVLYNTSDYAIVSEFTIENNTTINIHNNNVMKVALDNRKITYHKFKKVKTIRNPQN